LREAFRRGADTCQQAVAIGSESWAERLPNLLDLPAVGFGAALPRCDPTIPASANRHSRVDEVEALLSLFEAWRGYHARDSPSTSGERGW
jgi:hypothetical protein